MSLGLCSRASQLVEMANDNQGRSFKYIVIYFSDTLREENKSASAFPEIKQTGTETKVDLVFLQKCDTSTILNFKIKEIKKLGNPWENI